MIAYSSMPLFLLTLPTAAAFLHSNIYRNCAGRDAAFAGSRIPATKAASNVGFSQINEVIAEKRQELLSDPSKLRELHPKSTIAADNELRGTLADEVMVREVLLSSRLPLPFLNRTKLGPSTIEGAGRGLFATEDIAEGEVVTCYPGDLLLCEISSEEDEDGKTECVALWGHHVPADDRWDDDAVFDGTESTPPLTEYACAQDGTYSNMGHPCLDDNPAYFGHFANDGAGHLALAKSNSPETIEASLELGLDVSEEGLGIEDNIAAYVLKSFEVANGMHRAPDGEESHVVTVATRDIKEGEEILVTYGPDYWSGHDIDG